MHFYEETPLEDVVKIIQNATVGADGKGIPIYVDPIGLSEADKTMTSTIRNIELDGVPLRVSLALCLKQLDLAYSVRDGYLLITSEESYDTVLTIAFGGCISGRRALRARPDRSRNRWPGRTVRLPSGTEAGCFAFHARSFLITRPPTSVRRSSRPLCKNVSCLWSRPIKCRIVAWMSLTWAGSSMVLSPASSVAPTIVPPLTPPPAIHIVKPVALWSRPRPPPGGRAFGRIRLPRRPACPRAIRCA